jgi:hypothetical protein
MNSNVANKINYQNIRKIGSRTYFKVDVSSQFKMIDTNEDILESTRKKSSFLSVALIHQIYCLFTKRRKGDHAH